MHADTLCTLYASLVDHFSIISYQFILGSLCNSGEKCRSFSACASQKSIQHGGTCKQNDGSSGLCCKTITKNIQSNYSRVRIKRAGMFINFQAFFLAAWSYFVHCFHSYQ